MEEDAPIVNFETQVQLLKNVLEFNKKTSILGEKPSSDDIAKIRKICNEIEIFHLQPSEDDIKFLEQLAHFENELGGHTY